MNRYAMVVLSAALSCVGVVSAMAGNPFPDIALTTTSPAALGGVNFENDSLVAYNPISDVAQLLFNLEDEFGITRNMDAVHELPNGNLVISTQAGDTIGSLTFTENDLIELDRVNGTASMFLDASAIGLVGNNNTVANIDAVHVMDSGNVAFSVGSLDGATLLGVSYDNADVIEYDPVNNTAGILFDGSLIVGDDPDLHAFTVLDDGRYLLAAFNGGGLDAMTLAGQGFSRDDLVIYDPRVLMPVSGDAASPLGFADIYLEGVNEFANPGEIIDGVTTAVVPEPGALGVLSLGVLVAIRRQCR